MLSCRSLQDGKNPLTPLGNDYSFQNHAAAGAGVGGGGGAVIDQTQIRLNPAGMDFLRFET